MECFVIIVNGFQLNKWIAPFKGNDREYFSSDFERILSKFWVHSPCAHWTRIEIYAIAGVLCFAKRVIFVLTSATYPVLRYPRNMIPKIILL